ncbi:MAG: FhaA domain-containing protein [Solirubrobacteraceae bacterium]
MLRSLEGKLAGLVEGTFSRAFKSEVRPVEIARKLAREMDQHKVVSVSRTYVPNEYTVWLSARDRQQFEDYENDLREELSAYLLEHARRERVAFITRPDIGFQTDDRLRLGEFGIQARLVQPDDEGRGAVPGEAGHTAVYSAAERIAEPLAAPNARRGRAQLRHEGRAVILGTTGAVLGRSRDCEVVVVDENVSRRHAEVRPSGGAWTVRDLGSTNGVRVNGHRVDGAQSLKPGDRIELGRSTVTFEEA